MAIFGLILALGMMFPQAEIPAEPVIFATSPGDYGLSLEPSNPKTIVGVFLIACHNGTFVCADNGAEFHHCARWELADVGLKKPRFSNGKCLADKVTQGQ